MAEDALSTVGGLFLDRARRYPHRPFLSVPRGTAIETVSYGVGAARIAGIVEWLSARGFHKGDRVVCYLDEVEPGVWFYLACAALGVIPVPLAPSYSPAALGQLVLQARPKAVFTTPERCGAAATACERVLYLPDGRAAAGGEAIPTEGVPPDSALDRLARHAQAIRGDDLYMFQPTSGSTGTPKLVMRPHAAFTRAGRLCASRRDPAEEGHAGLLVQALTHGAGQYCLATLLHLGGRICAPSAIDTAVSLAEVERLEPTFLLVVPRVIRSLYEQHRARYGAAADETPFCGPALRVINTGAAALEEAIVGELEARGLVFVDGYGASEFSIVAVTEWGKRRPGLAGKIVDDVALRIGPDGEILVKTPVIMHGYFENEELTRQAYDADGYYLTGDLGAIEEGELRILGRKRDVFNSSEGANIYPVRIEDLVEARPWVAEAMLVGDGRPYLVALVVVKDGPASTEPDGFLDPERHPELYARARTELSAVNEGLETFERLRRVALFARPFGPAIYQLVGHAKVRRDRKALLAGFAARVARLYADPPEPFAV